MYGFMVYLKEMEKAFAADFAQQLQNQLTCSDKDIILVRPKLEISHADGSRDLWEREWGLWNGLIKTQPMVIGLKYHKNIEHKLSLLELLLLGNCSRSNCGARSGNSCSVLFHGSEAGSAGGGAQRGGPIHFRRWSAAVVG